MSITKAATQAVPDALKIAGRAGATASEVAAGLVAKNTNLGGLNLKEAGLAEDLARLAKSDPDRAAAVRDALKSQLSASNYREVSEAMPAAVLRVEDEALAARGVSAADRAKILDMVQMGFDVAGIFDPTPASDGISGAISLARGDWLGAGISLVSMVPYVGDLAKAGKIGKWAQAVAGGAEMLAKYGAGTALGSKALASLETIGAAIDKIPGAALDALPASTKRQLLEMRATIDGAVAKATGRGADDVAEAGIETAAKRDVIELEAGSTGGWNKQLNGKLKPDTDYVVGDYTYKTDSSGRVASAEGKLDLNASDRNGYQQRVAGREDRLADDHGGHLIATMFGGPGEGINLVAMNKTFNGTSGQWYKLETKLKTALENGSDVNVKIDLSYGANSKRPDALAVTYEIDGVSRRTVMLNEAPK